MLLISNVFMTLAWYGLLGFEKMKQLEGKSLLVLIAVSWGIAFFEYCFMVPANRTGFAGNGGPFSMVELKTIQEAVSLGVFLAINIYVFRQGTLQWNHLLGFGLMVLAVFVIFKKW